MHVGTVGAYRVRLLLAANGLVKRDLFFPPVILPVIKTDGPDSTSVQPPSSKRPSHLVGIQPGMDKVRQTEARLSS